MTLTLAETMVIESSNLWHILMPVDPTSWEAASAETWCGAPPGSLWVEVEAACHMKDEAGFRLICCACRSAVADAFTIEVATPSTTKGEPVRIGRYLIFSGLQYYAAGGWCDFGGSHSNAAEAISEAKRVKVEGEDCEWVHVVDARTGRAIYQDDFALGGRELPFGTT